jgi:hypothetical protein
VSEAKGSAQYDWIAAIGDQQENICVRNICGSSHPGTDRWHLQWTGEFRIGLGIFLTETNGIQASPFKGNHQKIFPDFKLGPFKAESIQNRSTERLRPELVEGSRRSPKSKIQNRNDHRSS